MIVLGICTAAVISGVMMVNVRVVWSTRRHISTKIDEVPEVGTAVVLGCTPQLNNGRPNFYFETRMDAAAALLLSGKVRTLVVSGGPLRVPRPPWFTECDAMFDALTARGVPPRHILVDPAGTRTWESVRRAHEHFGLREVVFVSQSFHNPRAVWLARRMGVESYGYNAASPSSWSLRHLRLRLREVVSRTRAVIDSLPTKKNVPGS
jgi:SanA protein